MNIELASNWESAKEAVILNSQEMKSIIAKNGINVEEFTSIVPGDGPYDFTCKWRGTKYNKLDVLTSKLRDVYTNVNLSEIRLLIMAVGVKKRNESNNKNANIRSYDSPQAFCRNELSAFFPVSCTTDQWDCNGLIPVQYTQYLGALPRPWSLDHLKGAMIQELDKYNRSLPKDMTNMQIKKDSFEIGFGMALSEYYNGFDIELRDTLAYDGTDPKKTIGFIIDALAITGNRDLQIAKIWQYCINVKRVLYPECGIKRRWHVVPTVVGKGGTGKTETFIHYLIKPLMGRGTATRFSDLADTRWTRAFSKYYGAMMDDLGYDDFTPTKEGTIKQLITGDTKLDRTLGSNKEDSYANVRLRISMCASSNYHIADLTNDDAMLRRLVELPSAKTGRKDITNVLHLDPNAVFRSIDESQLEYDPLMDEGVVDLWERDKAEARQHNWIYRGLRHLGYLPHDIEPSYDIKDGIEVTIEAIQAELVNFHRTEFGINPRGRVNISAKLEEVGIFTKLNAENQKSLILLRPKGNTMNDWRNSTTVTKENKSTSSLLGAF